MITRLVKLQLIKQVRDYTIMTNKQKKKTYEKYALDQEKKRGDERREKKDDKISSLHNN